jgi:3-hydroxybutyryl-CoA dehydrogenase
MTELAHATVLLVGAGTMGSGIAQVAAEAGHRVLLFDARQGAAAEARVGLAAIFDGLVAKGRLGRDTAGAALARVVPIAALAEGSSARLAIEAVVESLPVKRSLLVELEDLLDADAVLATNTSSLSVTQLAQGLRRPGRLVGMHFFNPAPLMKLVEVVSGLHTAPEVAEAAFQLARAWGKVPVHARSTPGFVVNRIARSFYAEALALLQERAVQPHALDACLRGAGFRMGPCELMDFIGHDVNLAVTQAIYEASFFDRRYAPSPVQRELVDGGLLGRKSRRGFYRYPEGPPPLPGEVPGGPPAPRAVVVHGAGRIAEELAASAARAGGRAARRRADSAWTGLEIDGRRLVLTDGRPAQQLGAHAGTEDVAVFDWPLQAPAGQALAFAVSDGASGGWRALAPRWLSALGFLPVPLADAPGLVVARTVAMLVNEAADAVLQGVCTREAADLAMKLGVHYPAGPFEWLSAWEAPRVIGVLDALDAHYRGERYRVSPWLRRSRPPEVPG